MDDRPAVNASPLIYLSRAGHLDLLRLVAAEIVLPSAVANEINQRGLGDVTAQAIASTSWIVVEESPPIPPEIQAWGLGAGESSVLAWAQSHPGSEAIIDDRAGRNCAAACGIPLRSTLGLVLVAKRRGQIPAARAVLDELRRAGMYLSDRVMNQALAMVGE